MCKKSNMEIEDGPKVKPEHETNISRSQPSARNQSTAVGSDGDKNQCKEEDMSSDPFSSARKLSPQPS